MKAPKPNKSRHAVIANSKVVTVERVERSIKEFFEKRPYYGEAVVDNDANWFIDPRGDSIKVDDHDNFASSILRKVIGKRPDNPTETFLELGFIRVEERSDELNIEMTAPPTPKQLEVLGEMYSDKTDSNESNNKTIMYDLYGSDKFESESVPQWRDFLKAVSRVYPGV